MRERGHLRWGWDREWHGYRWQKNSESAYISSCFPLSLLDFLSSTVALKGQRYSNLKKNQQTEKHWKKGHKTQWKWIWGDSCGKQLIACIYNKISMVQLKQIILRRLLPPNTSSSVILHVFHLHSFSIMLKSLPLCFAYFCGVFLFASVSSLSQLQYFPLLCPLVSCPFKSDMSKALHTLWS